MPRHSPYALVRLNFLYIVPILWFSLNCLSFFEHFIRSGLLTLLRMKRLFIRLLHLLFELRFRAALTRLPPCGEIVCTLSCAIPFSFGKTNISLKIICPLLFVFYSKILSSIRLSKILRNLSIPGRSGWTRTIDLALIRRAL